MPNRPRSNEGDHGFYAQLEQSLVAPEEALPTTSATVSQTLKHGMQLEPS
jgi:hypothetical protein